MAGLELPLEKVLGLERIGSPSTQPAESCVSRCDRFGVAGFDVFAAIDGMPESPHVPARKSSRRGGNHFLFRWTSRFLRMINPSSETYLRRKMREILFWTHRSIAMASYRGFGQARRWEPQDDIHLYQINLNETCKTGSLHCTAASTIPDTVKNPPRVVATDVK
jgi:hypothetical protein